MSFGRALISSLLAAALGLAAGTAAMAQRGPLPAPQPVAPRAPNYQDSAAWLCLPGRADACAVDESATVVPASGRARLEEFVLPAREPLIDCFYVYPTVSRDAGPLSDLVPGIEERQVIQSQFARFAQGCRPYAPIYRQITLTALNAALAQPGGLEGLRNSPAPGGAGPYADVLAAFRAYMANNNQGRGFVLIGHSQGANLLKRLIAEEIDGRPVQRYMVAAILLGTEINVPPGGVVGGTFKTIPLCTRDGQTGCLITYSSFRDTGPPPANALFGKSTTAGMAVACVNPANLRTGRGEPEPYFYTLGSGASTGPKPNWTGDPWAPVGTPFVKTPGLLTTQCLSGIGGQYLAVRVNGDPRDPRTDEINGDLVREGKVDPAWGLHLIDMNISMGDLVDFVARLGRAWRGPPGR
jgi:hypothetical protein